MSMGVADYRKEARKERARVKAIIDRDRIDRIREMDRERATLEVSEGVFVNLTDTVVEPTPEWLAHGDVRPFVVKQPAATARVVRSVRRVLTPVIVRLSQAGNISEEHLQAAALYRKVHDAAGLSGRYCSSRMEAADSVSREQVLRAGHMAISFEEMAARQLFRSAQAALPRRNARLVDAMVLYDTPLARAARVGRCRKDKVHGLIRDGLDALVSFFESRKAEIGGYDRR